MNHSKHPSRPFNPVTDFSNLSRNSDRVSSPRFSNNRTDHNSHRSFNNSSYRQPFVPHEPPPRNTSYNQSFHVPPPPQSIPYNQSHNTLPPNVPYNQPCNAPFPPNVPYNQPCNAPQLLAPCNQSQNAHLPPNISHNQTSHSTPPTNIPFNQACNASLPQNAASNQPYSNMPPPLFGHVENVASNQPYSNMPPPPFGHVENVASNQPYSNIPPPLIGHAENPQVPSFVEQANFISRMPPMFSMPNIDPPNTSVPPPYPFQPSVVPIQNLRETQKFEGDPVEKSLSEFLDKCQSKRKECKKSSVTVIEFRTALRNGFSLLKKLSLSRSRLSELLQTNAAEWQNEVKNMYKIQQMITETCSHILTPSNVCIIKKKLNKIGKKRLSKKKLKLEAQKEKLVKEKEREALNQEIDKWFLGIQEKNDKLNREGEMKKEADYILCEVRRKIYEAKKTLEKLKVFEKLRSAREENASKKGLFISEENTSSFESQVSDLKAIMEAQLVDYEAEEKALQVMLEAEREDHLEEEARWRYKKLASLQERRRKNILQCLFSDSDEPSPEDPLYLFYQFHNSSNSSIDNLIKIRGQWDMHLSEEGEQIPPQWVTPVPPSSPSWEKFCLNR